MCSPGVNPQRTDQQLAAEARYHLKILLLCLGELKKRGYFTSMRASSGIAISWPEATLEIKKEVQL